MPFLGGYYYYYYYLIYYARTSRRQHKHIQNTNTIKNIGLRTCFKIKNAPVYQWLLFKALKDVSKPITSVHSVARSDRDCYMMNTCLVLTWNALVVPVCSKSWISADNRTAKISRSFNHSCTVTPVQQRRQSLVSHKLRYNYIDMEYITVTSEVAYEL